MRASGTETDTRLSFDVVPMSRSKVASGFYVPSMVMLLREKLLVTSFPTCSSKSLMKRLPVLLSAILTEALLSHLFSISMPLS